MRPDRRQAGTRSASYNSYGIFYNLRLCLGPIYLAD